MGLKIGVLGQHLMVQGIRSRPLARHNVSRREESGTAALAAGKWQGTGVRLRHSPDKDLGVAVTWLWCSGQASVAAALPPATAACTVAQSCRERKSTRKEPGFN